MTKSLKVGVAGLLGVAAIAVGVIAFSSPAGAQPTITVYKTPT